jgi:hypothetical protein
MTKEQEQAKRLRENCCPVHGLFMSQISPWIAEEFCYVGCPSKDCDISAKSKGYEGPAYDVDHNKAAIEEEFRVEFWKSLKENAPEVFEALAKRLKKGHDPVAHRLLAEINAPQE